MHAPRTSSPCSRAKRASVLRWRISWRFCATGVRPSGRASRSAELPPDAAANSAGLRPAVAARRDSDRGRYVRAVAPAAAARAIDQAIGRAARGEAGRAGFFGNWSAGHARASVCSKPPSACAAWAWRFSRSPWRSSWRPRSSADPAGARRLSLVGLGLVERDGIVVLAGLGIGLFGVAIQCGLRLRRHLRCRRAAAPLLEAVADLVGPEALPTA